MLWKMMSAVNAPASSGAPLLNLVKLLCNFAAEI